MQHGLRCRRNREAEACALDEDVSCEKIGHKERASSASVGGLDDDVDVFKAVALADGLSIAYAAFFVEVSGGLMVRGELIGIGHCRLDVRRHNRTNHRFGYAITCRNSTYLLFRNFSFIETRDSLMKGEKVERRRRLSSNEFYEILKKKKRLSSKEFRELFELIWQGTVFVKFQNPEVWREMPRGHDKEKL